MISYKEYTEVLDEATVSFGGKMFPKFGQIVILAGGAGSGKGFVQETLLGIQGKILDVDKLKELVIDSKKLATAITKETGYDIKKMSLKDPENVSLMHRLINDIYGISKKKQGSLFKSIATAAPDRKPNVIFDVTLKNIKKLKTISESCLDLGYAKENIHIVWVVNDVKMAISQNQDRDRVVPHDILIDTHVGAAKTMKEILSMGDSVKQYMDGDIWLAFNKRDVDISKKVVVKHGKEHIIETPSIPFQVKKKGQTQIKLKDIDKALYDKVKEYVPSQANVDD